jgi:malonyl-CoA O-methyltransferase
MDPALIPPTAAGRQLAWLMNLQAEPPAEEIQDHLEPTATGQVHVDLPEWAVNHSGVGYGLLAFGTMARGLPGVVTGSEDARVCLQLDHGAQLLDGEVAVSHQGSGKIVLFSLRPRPAEDEGEVDRIRLLYDRMAGTYEQLGALARYWNRVRAWLKEVSRDGCTILDVGCGPGHLTASLPASVHVIGCDLSPEMVRLAARARPIGSFHVHDYHRPFPARWPRADVTVAVGCLEFCSDLAQVARNLAAATKPDGRLLVTVPRAEPAAMRREITVPNTGVTVRLVEDAEVEAAVAAAGLEVTAHQVGPGFTAPGIGAVEYGYWELKVARVDVAVPRVHSA